MPYYKCLLYTVKDAVATLTLNRPERLNALGDTLRDDLHDAVLRATGDPDIRAIVLTSAGKGFPKESSGEFRSEFTDRGSEGCLKEVTILLDE